MIAALQLRTTQVQRELLNGNEREAHRGLNELLSSVIQFGGEAPQVIGGIQGLTGDPRMVTQTFTMPGLGNIVTHLQNFFAAPPGGGPPPGTPPQTGAA
jgi:hypothetical protein